MSTANALLATIKRARKGVSLAALLAKKPLLNKRTAQRWIMQWVNAGEIHPFGNARTRRYFGTPPPVAAAETTPFPGYIPISPASQEILDYLKRPLAARKPVGYQVALLEAYRPNKSCYLPLPLRRKLHRIGKTTDANAPAGTYSRTILNRLLIDLSWASSRLEGNTYSRLDTVKLIEHGTVAIGKDAIETQMILNHKSAIELLVDNVDSARFNRYTIMNLHSALAENLLPNAEDEGRVRQHAVEIGKSVYSPLSGEALIDSALDAVLAKADQIVDPFEQSFFIMVHLPYLQPFADMNKRTSRLAANLPLARANLCPLTFLDVPELAYRQGMLGVYELTRIDLLRDVFHWAYERSAQQYLAIKQQLAEPDPLRLAHRELIKQTVKDIVTHAREPEAGILKRALRHITPKPMRERVQAIIIEEVERLHEGVLARYGLRLSEFLAWKKLR